MTRCGLVIQLAVDGHYTSGGVDGESPAGVVVQAVGNRVGGPIRIGRQARDADQRAGWGNLENRVGRFIRLADFEKRLFR